MRFAKWSALSVCRHTVAIRVLGRSQGTAEKKSTMPILSHMSKVAIVEGEVGFACLE